MPEIGKKLDYFNQLVEDAVKELNKHSTAYCFTLEQLKTIENRVENIVTRYDKNNDMYIITKEREKSNEKSC